MKDRPLHSLRWMSDTRPLQLQSWEIGKQGNKHLTSQPYLVFSRFQRLLFLEVCVPILLQYLRVLCTLLVLGHFSSFLVVG